MTKRPTKKHWLTYLICRPVGQNIAPVNPSLEMVGFIMVLCCPVFGPIKRLVCFFFYIMCAGLHVFVYFSISRYNCLSLESSNTPVKRRFNYVKNSCFPTFLGRFPGGEGAGETID